MHKNEKAPYDRREFLKGSSAIAGVTAAGSLLPAGMALAQQAKLKVGLMLPYTGTFAQLGVAGARLNISRWTMSPTRPRRRKMPTSWSSATRSMW
jgi:hypothetical protein